MLSRRVPVYAAAGLISLSALGAGGYAYWANGRNPPAQRVILSHIIPRPHARDDDIRPDSAMAWLLFDRPGPALGTSPMVARRPLPAHRAHRHATTPLAITRVSVPAPLDLRLPAGRAADDPGRDARTAPFDTSNDPSDLRWVISLNPNIDERAADPGSSPHLFNRDNGLRGFMTHNWLNERVGLQGGLAIKQRRLRTDNSDLRDNVAIGMGLLLSF